MTEYSIIAELVNVTKEVKTLKYRFATKNPPMGQFTKHIKNVKLNSEPPYWKWFDDLEEIEAYLQTLTT